MEKPAISINGSLKSIKTVKGSDWRSFAEFLDKKISYDDPIFIEEQAKFIANFFDDVSVDDILNLPLEEILPVSFDIRNFMIKKISEKVSAIEKNAEPDVTSNLNP